MRSTRNPFASAFWAKTFHPFLPLSAVMIIGVADGGYPYCDLSATQPYDTPNRRNGAGTNGASQKGAGHEGAECQRAPDAERRVMPEGA